MVSTAQTNAERSRQNIGTEQVEGLLASWSSLGTDGRIGVFSRLDGGSKDDLFLALPSTYQAELILGLEPGERLLWLRALAPDDAADLIQHVPPALQGELLGQLDEPTRQEVRALLAYAEDVAGGLMSPRFARTRRGMTVGESIRYVREQASAGLVALHDVYVLDEHQHLLGVLSLGELFAARDALPIVEVMHRDFVSVAPHADQEAVARVISLYDLTAVPVVNGDGVLQGIVTVDDVIDVLQQEASEDIHKAAGMAALELPYMKTGLATMVRKRAGWLAVLFVGEMLTATAMSSFESEISKAVVLAVFVPLIISSGGNSGSQAASLVIRALALGEVRLADWWRVARREVLSGLALGAILGAIGLVRVLLWGRLFGTYGDHAGLIAMTVGLSLIGVVLWGTLSGTMLPFVIRRLGFDPASASAPFVATLVDVTGLVIYFSVAHLVLGGVLL
jgi:magnesium transporter